MMGNDRGRVGTNGAACDKDSVTGSSVGECWVIVGCTVLVGGMAFWIASCGLGAIRRVATGCVAVADCMSGICVLAARVCRATRLCVALRVADAVLVRDNVLVAAGVLVRVLVRDAVLVLLGVRVVEGVLVWLGVRVVEGVLVWLGVRVNDGVLVSLGVRVTDGVLVRLGVRVTDGVLVGLLVWVCDAVVVGEGTAVSLGVSVGTGTVSLGGDSRVAVAVDAAVAAAVGWGVSLSSPTMVTTGRFGVWVGVGGMVGMEGVAVSVVVTTSSALLAPGDGADLSHSAAPSLRRP
jgi:hypothetical protein